MKIHILPATETYYVRQQVLRPGRPPEECQFDGDLNENTFHLGAVINNEIIGVASFMNNNHPSFLQKNQYQLRGMAVLDSFKNKGVGTELLLEGEKILHQTFADILLWFNARESALGFYKNHGYEKFGTPFMVPNVCIHQVMYKLL